MCSLSRLLFQKKLNIIFYLERGRTCPVSLEWISLTVNQEFFFSTKRGNESDNAKMHEFNHTCTRQSRVPKFQRTSRLPSSLGNFCFKNEYTSRAFAPFTSVLSKNTSLFAMSASNCLTNSMISSLVPGSWPPNWLQGKARIFNPRAPNSSWSLGSCV